MRFAFAIFKFFPHGGIARDLTKIVSRCRERGHEVRIYALEWEGPRLDGVEIIVLAARGVRSHVRQRRFAERVAGHVASHPVDLVAGMNKLPGLDVYYAADSCFEDKARTQRPWPYRLTSRYRHYAEFERTVFAENSGTRILTIAPNQDVTFRSIYRTPAHRFHALPPAIEVDRRDAMPDAGRALRREFGVADTDLMLLFVGSGFVKKGLDRAIAGVAALPSPVRARVRFFVVGDDRATRFQRLVRRLRVTDQVRFVGGRDDIAAWYSAADALVLPAYDEAAGMVILEAASAGVPVLATANCGYAPILEEADAGIVTPVPFDQETFNADLERLLTGDDRPRWSRRGRELAANESLGAMAPRAVDLLEAFAAGDEPLVSFCAIGCSRTDPRYRSLVPVAEACRRRGLQTRVFVDQWHGAAPAGVDLVVAPVTALGRTKRRERRREWVAESLRSPPVGLMVRFDAAPCIDICSVMGRSHRVDCRLDGLPPGIGTARTPPERSRETVRAEYGFAEQTIVFALAGGDLLRHGFERLLMALGRLPEELRERCAVLAAGRLAVRLGPAERVFCLNGRIRVDAALAVGEAIEAADAFVDLSYRPCSNGWIFDALAAGRPVITHEAVHESDLVSDARAGVVLTYPFRQADLNRALVEFLASTGERASWSVNAARFAANPGHFGQADRVAAAIEQHASGRSGNAASVPA